MYDPGMGAYGDVALLLPGVNKIETTDLTVIRKYSCLIDNMYFCELI